MKSYEDLEELRAMRVQWQALATRWELTGTDNAKLFPEGGWDRPNPPGDTEYRMRQMLALDHRLPFQFDPLEASAWARTPIDQFDLLTPLEIIAEGKAPTRALCDFLDWKYS